MPIAIIGGADGPTAIYIAAPLDWESILIFALMIAAVDALIFIVLRIIENKKKPVMKFGLLLIAVVNVLLTVLLFPGLLTVSVVINIVLAVIGIVTIFRKRKKK